jgi:hypothetical protein
VSASGGVAPYSFSVSAGNLPTGLSLSSGGVLSGTPTASGSFGFTVTASDANTQTGNRVYTVVIGVPTLSLLPASLPNGAGASPYSATFTASGGVAPYTYAVSAGTLPAGLSLSTAGVLSGTPTVSGSFSFSVLATDSTGGTAATVSNAYTLQIATPTISILTSLPPGLAVGSAINLQLNASGGTGPYTYAVTTGILPPGLSLSPSGLLSGVASASGVFNFTLTVTDASGFTGTRAYTLGTIPTPTTVPTQTPAGLILLLLAVLAIGWASMRGSRTAV